MGMDEENTTSGSILEQNCRPDWPKWTCLFANVCGLCSTALWFIVLLPQVWKNFHRKSVKGLSVLWATANFTASMINLFFVFIYASIPLYGQISSVYMPILEFTLLVQFWIYGRQRTKEKIVYATACFLLWAIVIILELVFTLENFVEYAAIFLWCIETFPQVILNMKLHSTSGQSTGSVAIAMVGKTTDFLSNTCLVMPLQYVIMVYFSSSVAYVNGLQVAWYYGNDNGKSVPNQKENGGFWHTQNDSKNRENYGVQQSTEPGSNTNSTGQDLYTTAQGTGSKHSICVIILRWTVIAILSLLLLGCVAGFVWNINSFFGLFAPFSIFCVIGTAKLYFQFNLTSSYRPHDKI